MLMQQKYVLIALTDEKGIEKYFHISNGKV